MDLYRRTIPFPDLIPPFLQDMIPGMYEVGILKSECRILECVGFNKELYSTLLGPKTPTIPIIIPMPAQNSSKRSVSHDSLGRDPRKKQKTAS